MKPEPSTFTHKGDLISLRDAQDQQPADKASNQAQVPTALICTSTLLCIGLQRLLAETCFVISDTPFDGGSPFTWNSNAAPALVIVEENHCPGETAKVIRHVKAQCPGARVVVLADRFELEAVMVECAAGADGFCQTSSSRDVLITSLELIMLGEAVLPPEMVVSMLDGLRSSLEFQPDGSAALIENPITDPNARKLSNCETKVLRHLMEGATNKLIAREFDVTEATVKVHVKAILRKVGVANRTQAAIWAAQYLPRADQGASSIQGIGRST
jgi:two-component system, NarL family, nitrate/nitrite response regulator NarL